MLRRLAASHRTLTVAPTLGVTTRTARGTHEHEAPLARTPRTGCPRLITARSPVQILPPLPTSVQVRGLIADLGGQAPVAHLPRFPCGGGTEP